MKRSQNTGPRSCSKDDSFGKPLADKVEWDDAIAAYESW
jgi:hypothetical protein